MLQSSHFKLYGNCIPVKGYAESIICDLERCCYLPVTNLIFEIVNINEVSKFSITELKNHFGNQYDQGIDTLFKYIKEQGYGFYTNDPELFPKISFEWDAPYPLTNAVVEIRSNSLYTAKEGLSQLKSIGCQALELRFLDVVTTDNISELLKLIDDPVAKCVFIYMAYTDKLTIEEIVKIYLEYPKIGQIIIHSAPINDKFEKYFSGRMAGKIIQITKCITNETQDEVSMKNMVLNMRSFTEACNFNLGLNRKVSIDVAGNIKNYLTHSKVYGDIHHDKIEAIINTKEFTNIWKITKDQVEVCRDCQYRYMCMDNVEIVQKEGKLFRINNCSFNPFRNIWNN